MAGFGSVRHDPHQKSVLTFKRFRLEDRALIQSYVDNFKPVSCEYNFSNLFAWQDACQFTWTVYQDRVLIYDGISQSTFMPLGEPFEPGELVELSKHLKRAGLSPDFCLFTLDYIKMFSHIEDYYQIKPSRDDSEYVYQVDKLCELKGKKLHKKRNLISQFRRRYPDYKIQPLKGEFKHKAFVLTEQLYELKKTPSKTLEQELAAMKESFDHFEALGLEGLVLTVKEKVIAFTIFSPLPQATYDIQFEKIRMEFKGAAQVINQETALYLNGRCSYLNREQDLGIKGLRQAKLSYGPEKLITPYQFKYMQGNW